jgi:hypothetical protein
MSHVSSVCLRPKLVSCMLVVVERPSLNEAAIAHVEDNRLQAVQLAPIAFALRDVHPDGMLVAATASCKVTRNVPPERSASVPKKASSWSMPW